MRFTITPLGSAGGRSVGQVVDDIVRYLDGPQAPAVTSPSLTPATDDGPSRYYADGSADPGRWLGNGAAEMGLTGAVASRDFARVLAGRDPDSGVRLITAQGSAGRRPTLARGTQTRWDVDGEPLYDTRDAATALRLEVAEVERLVAAGEALAVRHLVALLGGAAPGIVEFEGSYLAPVIDRDGTRWITEQELQRCEAGRAAGPDPDAVAAAGQPADLLTLSEAARVAGLSTRYLRTLCTKWERNRERIEAARTAGKEPQRPFLAAHRGVKGQWLVKRADLVDFLRHRKAPAVRVGYDLTLTTEKSLGVLALLGDEKTRAAVLGAIQAGNDRGLAHLEYAAAMARVKGEPVSTRGWTVASFRHLTSRALDPFPHHHNVVANTVVDPDGTRRALDARWLYRHAGEASALATAEMRYRLTTELGVRWRRGRKGGWEIDGIPDRGPPRVLPAHERGRRGCRGAGSPDRPDRDHRRASRAGHQVPPRQAPCRSRGPPRRVVESRSRARAHTAGFGPVHSGGRCCPIAARSPGRVPSAGGSRRACARQARSSPEATSSPGSSNWRYPTHLALPSQCCSRPTP